MGKEKQALHDTHSRYLLYRVVQVKRKTSPFPTHVPAMCICIFSLHVCRINRGVSFIIAKRPARPSRTILRGRRRSITSATHEAMTFFSFTQYPCPAHHNQTFCLYISANYRKPTSNQKRNLYRSPPRQRKQGIQQRKNN